MKIIISLFLFTQITSAYGAICKYLPQAKVSDAIATLVNYKKANEIAVVDLFCESCRDISPKPIVIDTIEVFKHGVKGFGGVRINGANIDLAHLYINGENMAYKYNCQTKYISRYL